nr:N-formylglutamate amidohydrolase [Salipiger mucosus]
MLVCEHASNHIPARYDGLGLGAEARESHAAWDPGARALAVILSGELDAPLIAGRVSRLVYDCNRPPEAESAIPAQTEQIAIPGNRDLAPEARAERVETIHDPFASALASHIAARQQQRPPFALVTVHSFTPRWFGEPRAVEIGLLHDSDTRLADAMLARAGDTHFQVERNAPYGPEDGVTHTLKRHGIRNGLPNAMIEVRNDLLTTPEDRERVAEALLVMLVPALDALGLPEVPHA